MNVDDVPVREMTLDEYVAVLSPHHLANRQLSDLKDHVRRLGQRIDELEAENAKLHQDYLKATLK